MALALNPSWELARSLHGDRIEGLQVHALQLPCVFARAGALLHQALRKHRPHDRAVTRTCSRAYRDDAERVAINLADARICDNAGAQPLDQRLRARGPAAYFGTLPVKAMVAALQAQGLPAAVSHSAGTYVCNAVFYELMHALSRRRGVRGGFMHVPLATGDDATEGGPGLSLTAMREGVRAALAAACRESNDLALPGGTEY